MNGLSPEILMACRTMCLFGSSLLCEGPDRARLSALARESRLLREPPFSPLADGAASRLADALDAAAADAGSFEAFYRGLRQDYAFLFYQVSLSKASPFESVYRTDDATLFGPSTLAVRREYGRFGLASLAQGSRPDDHLGVELAFLAELFGRVLDDGRQASECLEAARRFVHEHVLAFSGAYLGRVAQVARTAFYRDAARVVDASIAEVACVLDAWHGGCGEVDAKG